MVLRYAKSSKMYMNSIYIPKMALSPCDKKAGTDGESVPAFYDFWHTLNYFPRPALIR